MMRKSRPRILLALLLCMAGIAAAAEPTIQQVYDAARSGRLPEAQQLMSQVLREHPDSAKAHYVAAEIDARAGSFDLAREELRKAQQLKPGLPFANPLAVQALERELGLRRGAAAGAPPAARAGLNWGWIVLLAAGAVLLWALLRPRRPVASYPVSGPYAGPTGYGPGMGPGMPPMAPGGSGILGSLGTGLAIGAGVAAGEELVHHMLDGNGHPVAGGIIPGAEAGESPLAANPDMGGNNFGVSDPGSWDDGGGLTGGDVGGGDWT